MMSAPGGIATEVYTSPVHRNLSVRAGEPLRFHRFDVRAQRFADKVRRARVMDDCAEARGGAHVGARHASRSVHFSAMIHVVRMIIILV